MAHSVSHFRYKMLVVHKTPLVAQDLREALLSAGALEVETAEALPSDVPSSAFDICFLSLPDQEHDNGSLLDRAGRIAQNVVLVMGFLQTKPALPPNFAVLLEPFRTEDILSAVLGIHDRRGGVG